MALSKGMSLWKRYLHRIWIQGALDGFPINVINHAPAFYRALIVQSHMTYLKHVTPMYGNVNFR